MKYPALSDRWRLEMATKPRLSGQRTIGNGQSRVLATAKQVAPLSLFPDTLVVEELRIVWKRKLGFWMHEVISIMATDIASVDHSNGLFFGHIHVQSLTGGREIFIDNLKKRDVYKLRSLVEGIALSAREGLMVNEENLQAEKDSLMKAGAIN